MFAGRDDEILIRAVYKKREGSGVLDFRTLSKMGLSALQNQQAKVKIRVLRRWIIVYHKTKNFGTGIFYGEHVIQQNQSA